MLPPLLKIILKEGCLTTYFRLGIMRGVCSLGSLELRSPVILASGLQGDTPQRLKEAYDTGVGAVVTKSVTMEPRAGHPEPNLIKRENGGWINAIGLKNVGARRFAKELGRPTYPVIVSLAGNDPSDFVRMIEMFDGAAAFEINLSCPSVVTFGYNVGDDASLTTEIIRAAKSATDVPIFVKIAYTMLQSVDVFVKAGADGITAINTVPAMEIDITTGKPKLGNGMGGLSGPPIKSTAIYTVHKISKIHDIPIMGCGGISSWRDAVEFLLAGADAIQVGSAAMENVSVLRDIAKGVKDWQLGHHA